MCAGCNSECRVRNLLDFMGTNLTRKFHLKKLLLKMFVAHSLPDDIRKMNGNEDAMILWMHEHYKPEESMYYERMLTLDAQDWLDICKKFDIK